MADSIGAVGRLHGSFGPQIREPQDDMPRMIISDGLGPRRYLVSRAQILRCLGLRILAA